MKEFTIGIMLLIWFALLIMLTFSLVGLAVIMKDYDERSTFMQIGFDLKDALINIKE